MEVAMEILPFSNFVKYICITKKESYKLAHAFCDLCNIYNMSSRSVSHLQTQDKEFVHCKCDTDLTQILYTHTHV